jgi:hypothetical protein
LLLLLFVLLVLTHANKLGAAMALKQKDVFETLTLLKQATSAAMGESKSMVYYVMFCD